MNYCGYITRIKNIRKHSNADRLLVGEVFGNYIIVGLDINEGDIGVYFPTDGRLSMEFCEANNLLRKKDDQGNNIGGYLEPEKRHVSSLKLRGEKSDGLFMPLQSLTKFCNINDLKEGDMITTLKGVLICEKYIPKSKRRNAVFGTGTKKIKKKVTESYPFFEEHIDTSQLAYNTHAFREGDICYLTLKMHGTSQRTAHTIKEESKTFPYAIYKILKLLKIPMHNKRTWEYVTGTRRVVLKNYKDGYYGSNVFRQKWHDFFVGKLWKGLTVYYEVVGYTQDSQTIMPSCSNSKTKDKNFIKQWGETTQFTYGCATGENDIYVYRMTTTNEDGNIIEIPWEIVKIYCDKIGVKHVPQLDKFLFTTSEDLMKKVNAYVEGSDPIGKNHIKEGVVVRIEGKEKFTAYKHKSFWFKCLEGIIKSDDILDMEEEEIFQRDGE